MGFLYIALYRISIHTIGFYDLNHGVSFGHTYSSSIIEKIFYTTNSGVSWIQANYPQELMSIADVQYINANTIYACGGRNILHLVMNYNPVNDFRSLSEKCQRKIYN